MRSNWIVTPAKFLTGEQVAVLRASIAASRQQGLALDDPLAVRNAALLEVLLGSGLRVSEACALRVGDLFLDGGRADLLVRHGKGGKARMVAMSGRLAEYLRDFVEWKASVGQGIEDERPLFLSERGGGLTRSAVHRMWKAALAAAGLPRTWGVHATRHSYAVEIYRRTRDLRLTQRLLGHANVATTTVYANLLDEDVRRGVELVWGTRCSTP